MEKDGVTRREFLRASGIAAIATGLGVSVLGGEASAKSFDLESPEILRSLLTEMAGGSEKARAHWKNTVLPQLIKAAGRKIDREAVLSGKTGRVFHIVRNNPEFHLFILGADGETSFLMRDIRSDCYQIALNNVLPHGCFYWNLSQERLSQVLGEKFAQETYITDKRKEWVISNKQRPDFSAMSIGGEWYYLRLSDGKTGNTYSSDWQIRALGSMDSRTANAIEKFFDKLKKNPSLVKGLRDFMQTGAKIHQITMDEEGRISLTAFHQKGLTNGRADHDIRFWRVEDRGKMRELKSINQGSRNSQKGKAPVERSH